VKALLAAGASTEIRNTDGQTAVHLAAGLGNEVIVQTLLQGKASPDVVDKNGKSCLEVAAVHDSCSAALKRIGADGWTPLMVAAEKGGPVLEKYLLCRNYCLSIKNMDAFPERFCHEIQFYSGLLPPKSSKFEWGRKWNMTYCDKTNKFGVATGDEAKVACAVGKDEFESGIHTWKVYMSDFRGMAWIGVARYLEDVACDPRAVQSCKRSYIVYFESGGAEGVVGVQPSKQVHFDQISASTFSAGQTIELQLDTFKSSLEMRIDGSTRTIAFNIETSDIRPYVCFENSGSASIVESTSRCSNVHSVISAEERSAGLDNSLWSSDLDKALRQCFKLGTHPKPVVFIRSINSLGYFKSNLSFVFAMIQSSLISLMLQKPTTNILLTQRNSIH
jgi:hypothetical protein